MRRLRNAFNCLVHFHVFMVKATYKYKKTMETVYDTYGILKKVFLLLKETFMMHTK